MMKWREATQVGDKQHCFWYSHIYMYKYIEYTNRNKQVNVTTTQCKKKLKNYSLLARKVFSLIKERTQ